MRFFKKKQSPAPNPNRPSSPSPAGPAAQPQQGSQYLGPPTGKPASPYGGQPAGQPGSQYMAPPAGAPPAGAPPAGAPPPAGNAASAYGRPAAAQPAVGPPPSQYVNQPAGAQPGKPPGNQYVGSPGARGNNQYDRKYDRRSSESPRDKYGGRDGRRSPGRYDDGRGGGNRSGGGRYDSRSDDRHRSRQYSEPPRRQSGGQYGGQPGGQPGGQYGGQPGGQPGGQYVGQQPTGQAGGQSGGQPGGKPGGQYVGQQPTGQPGGQYVGQQPAGPPGGQYVGQPTGPPGGQYAGHAAMQYRAQPAGPPGGQYTTGQAGGYVAAPALARPPHAQGGFAMGQQVRTAPIAIPNAVTAMPIQLTGLPMLQPHSVLDTIIASNCLVIVQAAEPFEMMTGIETPNRYTVHDMFMRPILTAQEMSNPIACQTMGNSRPFNMVLSDNYGRVFMDCLRQFQGLTDNLMTAYPPGNVISTMSKAQMSNMFAIAAVGCSQQIFIQAPLITTGIGNARFPILTASGAFMGEIVRLYPGYLQEAISDADTFLIHFPVEMPAHIKLTLLSAVFLIDYQYFENAAGTPQGVQAGGIGTPGFHGFY